MQDIEKDPTLSVERMCHDAGSEELNSKLYFKSISEAGYLQITENNSCDETKLERQNLESTGSKKSSAPELELPKMSKGYEESTAIFQKPPSYSTINGGAESPAGSAESAGGWAEDENCGGGSATRNDDCEGVGGGGRTHKGLSMALGAMFLIGEMAGAGVLNLPKAISNTGWIGVPLMTLLCVAVGYAGTRLALCWVILEDRWPEYRSPCRRPYPAIAYRALGKIGKYVADASLGITLFGASTVYLLVATQMLHSLFQPLTEVLTTCSWSLILALIITPLTWFGTPKDFWPASILAMSSTFLACVVVVTEVVLQRGSHDPPSFPPPTFSSFFLGFGSILFALGGASIFPTVQNDMRDRSEFPASVITTFLVLLSLYFPITIICYGTLGNGVTDNILDSVSGSAVTVTQALLLCHFLFAFTIVANPVMQTLESFLHVPNKFGIKRCVVRCLVMCCILLMGLAVPEFSKILDLIGGSTVTLMSFVLPPVCYLRLSAIRGEDNLPIRRLTGWEKLGLYVIVAIGIVGGIASTISALKEILSPKAFSSTCFSKSMFFS